MEKIIGYFMEDGIYWKGEKQPLRKTPVVAVDDNGSDNLHVLSAEGNWYTIKRNEFIKCEEENEESNI